MIGRHAAQLVRDRLAAFPAVSLVGPRQSGKTTLAQGLGGQYFDLEQEGDRLRLDLAWAQVTSGDELVVLDEAQTWPELFPRLRGAIVSDRDRRGRFLLLGSTAPALMHAVSESLAGRLALVELSPLSHGELQTDEQRGRHWLCGGFPDGGVLAASAYPHWQTSYLALLAQRDLPGWGLPAKPQVTDRLFRMLAAEHGSQWNASKLGASLGLSYHTVNSYLDHLEGAFLIRRLRPFAANLRKRLVKRPKVYWRDVGLLHALLQVPDGDELLNRPWVGASWEGYVIEQAIAELHAADIAFQPYRFRTSDGYELDLVLDFGDEVWAVEIKLTASPTVDQLRRLDATADMIGATRRFLVSQTPTPAGDGRRDSLDLAAFLGVLRTRGKANTPSP